jgi:hypothetical protein
MAPMTSSIFREVCRLAGPRSSIYMMTVRQQMESGCVRGHQKGSFQLDARIQTRRVNRWARLMADVAFEHGRPVRIFGAKQDITYEKSYGNV